MLSMAAVNIVLKIVINVKMAPVSNVVLAIISPIMAAVSLEYQIVLFVSIRLSVCGVMSAMVYPVIILVVCSVWTTVLCVL